MNYNQSWSLRWATPASRTNSFLPLLKSVLFQLIETSFSWLQSRPSTTALLSVASPLPAPNREFVITRRQALVCCSRPVSLLSAESTCVRGGREVSVSDKLPCSPVSCHTTVWPCSSFPSRATRVSPASPAPRFSTPLGDPGEPGHLLPSLRVTWTISPALSPYLGDRPPVCTTQRHQAPERNFRNYSVQICDNISVLSTVMYCNVCTCL